jgi:Tfp pilus assembly protein PilX
MNRVDMRNFKPLHQSAADAGFILPTVVIVVFIVTLLAGAAITVATQSSTSTTRDNNVKAALAAAESGLQIASYRITQLNPKGEQCITGSAKQESATCESTWEPLGNGASFHYTTTKALAAGEKCAGQIIEAKTGIAQRCVTSEGRVNGVEPYTRVQALIESAVGEALFKVKGILGLEEVLVSGNVKATSVVASNGKITSGGKGSAAFEKGYEICPGGSFTPAVGEERTKSGVTVGPEKLKEDPALEITRSSECPLEANLVAAHPTAAENEDSRINGELVEKGKETSPKFSGAPHYELNLEEQGVLKLGGSKYYFCNVTLSHEAKLEVATGAKVELFVDSPADGCPTGSGTFTVEGNTRIENPNAAGALLIKMAGKGPLTIANSGAIKANIYAPEAEVILKGAGTLTGSIVGKKVHLEGGAFLYSEEEPLIVEGSSGGSYSRKGWEQCTSGSGATPGC